MRSPERGVEGGEVQAQGVGLWGLLDAIDHAISRPLGVVRGVPGGREAQRVEELVGGQGAADGEDRVSPPQVRDGGEGGDHHLGLYAKRVIVFCP